MKLLNKIGTGIFPSNHYGWITVLFLLALIPNFFVAFFGSDLAGNIFKQLAYLILSGILLVVPAFLLKTRAYFLLLSLFLVLAPVEIAHIVLNRMPVNEGFVSAILQTNQTEAIELLSFLKYYLLIGVLVIILYYLILFTRIENKPLLTRNGKCITGGVFILFNLCLWMMMWKLSGYEADNISRFHETNSNFKSKYTKTYPLDLIKATTDVLISRKEVRRMEEKLKDFSFHAVKRETVPQREIYVFVIGESARYGNFSINGYDRPTSPLLKNQPDLISYTDVLSTANLTSTAMRLMLTRATPLDPETAYKEKALTDAFKECDFQVAWIANQSVSDRFIQRITAPADYTYFSTTDYDAATSYDGKLLDPLDEVLQKKNPKQLIVIHTLGSHFRYNSRYPDSFCRFTPALHDNTTYNLSAKNRELLVNSYDNSILYTDYVLNEIISRLDREEAVSTMIYLSDHGENLYDDASNMAVHANARPTRLEIHVPLFIWTSRQYRELWPEKTERMNTNRDEAVSTSNLFHSLLDMADITYPGEKRELSIASEGFKADSLRYVLTPDKQIMEINLYDDGNNLILHGGG